MVRQVLSIFFLMFALLGYSYFGPPYYTHYLTSNVIFRRYIGPAMDRMVLSGQQENISVGYLSLARGDLTFRPSTELVFLPAREGQRFYGGTLVSSGEQSDATITLADNSHLSLAANSTVYLEYPQGGMENGVIQLKVIKGTVEAEQTEADSKLRVKLVTPRGRVARVERRKLVVVAPTQIIDPRKRNPAQLLSDLKPKQEFVGIVDEAPAVKDIEKALIEGRPLNVVQRKEIFEKIDPELEAELNRPRNTVKVLPLIPGASSAIKVADEPATSITPSTTSTLVAPAVVPAIAPAVVAPPALPPVAVVTPPVIAPPAPTPPVPTFKPTVSAPRPVARTLPRKLPRMPAAVEKPLVVAQPAVERRAPIEERKAKPRQNVKSFEAPPSGSELSGAMFAAKQGDKDTAKRLVASALTKSEYGTSAFNDATRFAVDELMQGYMDSNDCPQAKNTILNVSRAYPNNDDAKTWSKKWRDTYKQKCQ